MVSKEEMLREIVRSTGMTHADISERMNRTSATIATEISRGTSFRVMKDLSELTGKNLKWLASGDGKWN